MGKGKPKSKEKIAKKEFHKEIEKKLEQVLADFKQEMGEKKFSTRIKKASTLFSRGVKKATPKNDEKVAPKKKAKKAVDQVPIPDPAIEHLLQ